MKKTLTCYFSRSLSLKGLTSAVILGGMTILNAAFAQTTDTYSTVGTTTWTVPNGVSSITIQSWGAGGGGGGARAGCASSCQQTATGGGGKGGMFAGTTISVTPGDVLSITVGAGGTGGVGNTSAGTAGGASSVSVASVVVVRALGGNGGNSGGLATNGSGATTQNTTPGSEIGTILWYGGNGVGGLKTTSRQSGGGGGGGAGDASNGVAAVNPAGGSGGPTGVSAGGAGGTANGGAGGAGGSGTNTGTTAGAAGSVRGGGGGGARGYSATSQVAANGGNGGNGEVRLTYNTCAANAGPAISYICEGGTTAALGGSVSGQSTAGIWSDGGIGGTFNPAATDLNATWTAPAAYTGTATLTLSTTNGGCPVNGTSSKTIVVAVAPSAPVFNAGAATICQGATETYGATAAGVSPSVTYSILSGGASINPTSGTVSNVTGNFTVRATASNNCGSAHTDFAVTVTPGPAAPTISANGPTVFCAGGSVVLSSSQPIGNVWSSSETTQTNTVTQSGDYTVTYTDGNGCSATSAITSVVVNSIPQPVITPASSTTFCEGGSVVLHSSGVANVWSTGETANSIEVDENDVITVTSTLNGCSSTSAAVTVTVNAAPAVPVITASGATIFCEGGSVILSSSEPTGNIWSSSETTQTNTVSASGSYTVTVTNGNGCTATSAPTVVTVNPNPAVPEITASGVTVFCEGQSVTLTSDASAGNEWSTGETTNSIVVDESASIIVTVTDGNGCTETSAAIAVLVNPNPQPTITASGAVSFCEGGSVTIISSETSGNVWSTGETTNSIVVDESGDITVTVTDANGCSAVSNEIEVVENSLTAPVITANGPTDFCIGGSVTITSSEASGNQWSTGETGNSITVTETMAVTVTNNSGCSSGISNTITVAVNPLPAVPVITPDGPTTICGNGSVTLSSSTTGNVWSTGETTNHITVTSAGTYSVVTTNGNGCSATSLPIEIFLNPVPVALVTLTNDITITASPSGQSYQWITCPDNEPVTGATAIAFSASENGSYAVVVTNSFGCKDTSACITISKVGIDDLAELSGIKLYPNPSTGLVTLASAFEEAVNLTVFDASGKALLHGDHLSGSVIDLTAFDAGIYIFRVETSKGISSHRMVIE